MSIKKTILIATAFCCIVTACKRGKPNIDNINVNIKVERFDKDLFTYNDSLPQRIAFLQQKYGTFFNYFCAGVINIGTPENKDFQKIFKKFTTDSVVLLSAKKSAEFFNDDNALNIPLTRAFKYFKYYFPDKNTPQIYTYVSGFNQSLMLTDSVVGIGLDKFLGENFETEYLQLGFSQYIVRAMTKERIPCDAVKVWAIGEFPFNDANCNLLEKMIYEGKLLYIQNKCVENVADSVLFNFSANAMLFCQNNENQMWRYLAENKLLYSTNRLYINKFTEDAPFTPDFSQESPGRAVNWIGFRIVQQYAQKNNASPQQIMNENDARKILEKSKYNP